MVGAPVVRRRRPCGDHDDIGRGQPLLAGPHAAARPRHVGTRLLPDARVAAGKVHHQLVAVGGLEQSGRDGTVLAHGKTQIRHGEETGTLIRSSFRNAPTK